MSTKNIEPEIQRERVFYSLSNVKWQNLNFDFQRNHNQTFPLAIGVKYSSKINQSNSHDLWKKHNRPTKIVKLFREYKKLTPTIPSEITTPRLLQAWERREYLRINNIRKKKGSAAVMINHRRHGIRTPKTKPIASNEFRFLFSFPLLLSKRISFSLEVARRGFCPFECQEKGHRCNSHFAMKF